MKCGYCGANLPHNAKKCKNCLARVDNVGQENNTSVNTGHDDLYYSSERPRTTGRTSPINSSQPPRKKESFSSLFEKAGEVVSKMAQDGNKSYSDNQQSSGKNELKEGLDELKKQLSYIFRK